MKFSRNTFKNIDVICNSINNLISYYENVLVQSGSFVEILYYQTKIKTCLTLLRFMELPQETVDKICHFIFSHEFREILINDKIMFIDKQLYSKGKWSSATRKIIENTLINYIDKHIEAIESGKNFESMSTNGSINYYSLVHYLSKQSDYHSRRLSIRVGKIIRLNNSVLRSHAIEHYVHHISPYQRARVISWAKKLLKETFDFKLFTLLINYNAKIEEKIIDNLCVFLQQRISDKEKYETTQKSSPFQSYPITDYYSELNQVSYWCFLGNVSKEKFSEFVGISNMFDFFYLYNDFDYLNFDVSWLLQFSKTVLNDISKKKVVREKIRAIISDALINKSLNATDELRLSKILAENFC